MPLHIYSSTWIMHLRKLQFKVAIKLLTIALLSDKASQGKTSLPGPIHVVKAYSNEIYLGHMTHLWLLWPLALYKTMLIIQEHRLEELKPKAYRIYPDYWWCYVYVYLADIESKWIYICISIKLMHSSSKTITVSFCNLV